MKILSATFTLCLSMLAMAATCAAQPIVAGIDYPSPYPVPFVGYTTSTVDPPLCVPGFSPQNYRSDLAMFKYCSARNVWSIFNGSNGAVTGTTATFTGLLTAAGLNSSAAVSPTAAGTLALGTAALPWGSIVLGTAATNAGTITPATMSAARAITLADPGGAATLAYINPTTQQTLSNTGIAQATTTVPFTFFQSPAPTAAAGSVSSTDFGAPTGSTNEAETQIYIPTSTTLTGACVQGGSAAATDKFIVVLRNQAGTNLANSATAGTLFATNSLWNCAAFTGTVPVIGPATYYIGTQTNGTTANVISLYASGGVPSANFGCGQVTDVFGTVAAVTVPTTFTAAKCPPVSTY